MAKKPQCIPDDDDDPADRSVDRMPNDPDPEEIARQCEIISAGWTPSERRKRRGIPHDAPKPDYVHRVNLGDL